MDEQAYKAWWSLHLRKARGETLTPEEQAVYEAGREQLYAEERLNGSIEELRRLRAEIKAMEEEHSQLLERRHEMQERAASLEAALSDSV
ncbi:MAG TPA: hypothetical protein VFB38_25515 [Chthonomonadaceae bacterium]|nr:hypothetical protein [Chthonomonadaceae bacterium]